MTSAKDIYISAQLVIDKCEDHHDPKEYALFRAKTFREEGDEEGAQIWDKIAHAVDELMSKHPKNLIH